MKVTEKTLVRVNQVTSKPVLLILVQRKPKKYVSWGWTETSGGSG